MNRTLRIEITLGTAVAGCLLLFAVVVTPPALLYAGTVGGLITFTAGSPASAAEVNSNFSALATEVNDNASTISDHSDEIAALEDHDTKTVTANGAGLFYFDGDIETQGFFRAGDYLKLADSAEDPTTVEGALRYNSGTVEFSNGTEWVSVGGMDGNNETLFQTKLLNSSVVTDGNIDEISFSGLTIDSYYRISGLGSFGSVNSTSRVTLNFSNNGNLVGRVFCGNRSSSGVHFGIPINFIFQAQSSDLITSAQGAGALGFISASGSQGSTFVTLEELPNHTEVSNW